MATELAGTGICVLTLWPGAVKTETTDFPGGESVEFAGRAVGALFGKATPLQLDGFNGKVSFRFRLRFRFPCVTTGDDISSNDGGTPPPKVIMTTELAATFEFTDVDGNVPGAARQRQERAKLESTVHAILFLI